MKRTDSEDGIFFTTRGNLAGDAADRKLEADRLMEIMNGFFAEHGRMPRAAECDQLFGRSEGETNELTYEMED